MNRNPVRLVAFDLDGTLLRGETVCEALARPLGKLDRMRELERLTDRAEVDAGRREMIDWYHPYSVPDLTRFLDECVIAPGALEAIQRLKRRGVATAIVSITWEFAVAWFAGKLGADYWAGTGWTGDGDVRHFWPEDKGVWLAALAASLGLGLADVAAVGDSEGDRSMLSIAGRSYFVGRDLPPSLAHVRHVPSGDINEIVRALLDGT